MGVNKNIVTWVHKTFSRLPSLSLKLRLLAHKISVAFHLFSLKLWLRTGKRRTAEAGEHGIRKNKNIVTNWSLEHHSPSSISSLFQAVVGGLWILVTGQ
jgi:hypothetical protein